MPGVGWVRPVGHYNCQQLMVGWVVDTAGDTAGGSVTVVSTVRSPISLYHCPHNKGYEINSQRFTIYHILCNKVRYPCTVAKTLTCTSSFRSSSISTAIGYNESSAAAIFSGMLKICRLVPEPRFQVGNKCLGQCSARTPSSK